MKALTGRRISLSVEPLETRALTTMVFLLSGDAFGAAAPSSQTRFAAADLARRGFEPVQLSYADMNSTRAFDGLANQIGRLSKGQPIGILGFSAGGALALRLAGVPGLNVKTALSFYGPPDLSDWLREHRGDPAYQRVVRNIGAGQAFTRLMSGPSTTDAKVIAAFGMRDRTVRALPSERSFYQDFPTGVSYFYPGPHGVNVYAKCGAYDEFIRNLAS